MLPLPCSSVTFLSVLLGICRFLDLLFEEIKFFELLLFCKFDMATFSHLVVRDLWALAAPEDSLAAPEDSLAAQEGPLAAPEDSLAAPEDFLWALAKLNKSEDFENFTTVLFYLHSSSAVSAAAAAAESGTAWLSPIIAVA